MAKIPELETIIDSVFQSMGVDQNVAEKAKTSIHTTSVQELLFTLSARLPKHEQEKFFVDGTPDISAIVTNLFRFYGEEEVKKQYRKIVVMTITDFLSHLKRANL